MDKLLSKEKTPAVLPLQPLHSARLQTRGNKKEERKKKKINKHHPLCLHLPLIYGPAEKPCCPQLLGSQLLFAMISSPLPSTRLPSRPCRAMCVTQGSASSRGARWPVPVAPSSTVGERLLGQQLESRNGSRGAGVSDAEQQGGQEQSGGLQVKPTRKLHFALSC